MRSNILSKLIYNTPLLPQHALVLCFGAILLPNPERVKSLFFFDVSCPAGNLCAFIFLFFRSKEWFWPGTRIHYIFVRLEREVRVVVCDATSTSSYRLHTFFFFSHFYFPASGQAVVTGVLPSPPRHRCPPFSSPVLTFDFIAHRVQQSHCSPIFHRALLTHALALSASQFVHKKKSQRICSSMHSAGLDLTKLTYTALEDNLIRHRGDR